MKAFAVTAILAFIPALGSYAQPGLQDSLAFGDIHPNLDAIEKAARRVTVSHCKTPECQAIAAVARAMDIMEEGMVTTMGDARPLPPNRDRIVDRRWRKEIINRPRRFAAICDTITGLASRYRGNEIAKGDLFVAVGVIELAGRIDGKGGPCLSRVLEAFPHLPAADITIGNARTSCIYSWKPWTACDQIKR